MPIQITEPNLPFGKTFVGYEATISATGAYMTSVRNVYLVGLSGSNPGTSKLAVSTSTTAFGSYPSPNGTSVTVSTLDPNAGNPGLGVAGFELGRLACLFDRAAEQGRACRSDPRLRAGQRRRPERHRLAPGSRVLAYRATISGKAQLFALPVAADGTPGEVVPISGVSGSGVSPYQLAPLQ